MRTLLVSAIAFVLLAGCTAREEAATSTPEPTPGVMIVDSAVPVAPPTDFTTAILEDGSYQHARLEVGPQTTIIWWNVDDLTHSVVSDTGAFAGSGPIPPGGDFARTFITPGEYTYHCRYHPDMSGTIIVK